MTLHFTDAEQNDFMRRKNEVHFESRLGFLNSHNGLRRGSVHLVIGTTSGGKSTLMRSLVRDIMFAGKNDPHLGLWLTEETVDEYRQQLALGLEVSDKLLNTSAFYEMDQKSQGEMAFFEWLEFHKPDVFILDNITTSKFYMDKRPDIQAAFAIKIKEITKRLNMATILVAHTDSSVNESKGGLIDVSQVRGSKQISNLAEFAYILQRFKSNNSQISTIRIVKHRSQELVHDMYVLNYEKKFRSYVSDKAIPFNEFKEAYDKRNKL